MASKKGTSTREAKVAKAGKRSGGYTEPPAPKSDNRAGRDMGEQQFVAKQQLTVQREVEVLVWDKALRGVVQRTKTVTIPVDQIFDPARGRLVFSPVFKEKEKRSK